MAEPTDPAATPTPSAADPIAPAAQPGAGTDPANPSQVPNNAAQPPAQQPQIDPKIAAALKTLEEAGVLGKEVFTKSQHDGHMGAARRQWQADSDKKAQDAAAEAQRQAQEEQGQFRPLYEQAQASIKEHETTIKGLNEQLSQLATHNNGQIDAAINDWPELAKLGDPGPGNLAARMDWFAKAQKLVSEQTPQRPVYTGTGYTPQPVGVQNGHQEITPPASRRSF